MQNNNFSERNFITNIIGQINRFVLDLVFPKICLKCQLENEIICDKCLQSIEPLAIQYCPVCEKSVTENGILCSDCKSKSAPICQMIASASYKDRLLSRAIHTFKYRFVSGLSYPLGRIMLEGLKRNLREPIDIIIPVPLHPRRLRWRGFNQAQLLARFISQNLLPGMEIPVVCDVVFRKKYTPPQMKIRNYQQRLENLKDSFVASDKLRPNHFKKKNILLVDDICTTGATIFECAKTLQMLKPKKIIATVLARQS